MLARTPEYSVLESSRRTAVHRINFSQHDHRQRKTGWEGGAHTKTVKIMIKNGFSSDAIKTLGVSAATICASDTEKNSQMRIIRNW